MTNEEKMQKVVEAAGERWHEKLGERYHCFSCKVKCHTYHPSELSAFDRDHTNPSPTDLNELFRLAEKLGAGVVVSTIGKPRAMALNPDWIEDDTPAEALLNALFSSIGGNNENM